MSAEWFSSASFMKPALFIVLLFFVACKGGAPGENPLADLDNSPEAAMEEFLCLDSIEAFGVTDFAVSDSLLWLLFQRPGSEDVLGRYDLSDKSYTSVIKRGRGPGEMITTTSLDDSGDITVADCNTNKMATMAGDAVSLRQLPAGGVVTCVVRGESAISTGVYPEGRYRLASLESGEVSYFGTYPQGDREIARELLPTAYVNSILALKPDGSRFVCVNCNCGVIDINAFAGDSIAGVARIAYHYPDVVGTRSGKMAVAAIRKSNVNGFFDVACSDEYIYTLYSGKTFNEAGLGLENCDFLVVFDWSCSYIGAFHVSPALSAIQFDNIQGQLYGLAHTPTRSLIYKLNLNR